MQTITKNKQTLLPIWIFIFVTSILAIIQVVVDNPMLLLERFVNYGGWIEIPFIAFYGAFLGYKMQDQKESPKWRLRSWTIFCIVFFSQLLLGIIGFEKFLMTGKLHLPIPMMILSGPLFRGETTFMVFLFLSTIILSGPAWCSQLCYMGAIDGIMAKKNKTVKKLKSKLALKSSVLFIVIFTTLLLRWFNVSILLSTIIAITFGVVGIAIMIFISQKRGSMIHCLLYCPIGTIVSLTKYINPFRMEIADTCTTCMKCSPVCRYDALNIEDIKKGKPAYSCTYCGDCLTVCKPEAIRYKLFNINSSTARNIYLIITISLHAIFLAVARI